MSKEADRPLTVGLPPLAGTAAGARRRSGRYVRGAMRTLLTNPARGGDARQRLPTLFSADAEENTPKKTVSV